jgi:hypothetical protein
MTRGASAVARKTTTIDELHALLKADLADETPLRYESTRSVHWQVARLASEVTANTGEASFPHATALRINMPAVQRFRAEIGLFRDADNQAGGGRDREALLKHLIANVRRLARAEYSEQVGRALFAAIAEGLLLLAWMNFDIEPGSALTQKYFSHARQFAHRAGNRLVELTALAAMSQQAHYAGLSGEAVELAASARKGTFDSDPACIRFFDESAATPWKPILKTVCGYPADLPQTRKPGRTYGNSRNRSGKARAAARADG